MGIRMTGLISGMDTETIIKQLVDAQKMKNKRTTDKRDLLSFKQEKWKDLNTKLLKLYENDLEKLRFQSNYNTKKATSSNEDVVSVTADKNTPEGTHTIEVIGKALPQFLTGKSLNGKVSIADGSAITGNSKLVSDLGMSATGIITVGTKNGQKQFEIDENTTLNSFANQLRNVGISANYDEARGMFFLGSKSGGEDNYFTLNTFDDPTIINRRKITEAVGYSALSNENKGKVDNAYVTLRSTTSTAQEKTDAINLLNGFASDKVEANAKKIAVDKTIDKVKQAIKNGGSFAGNTYPPALYASITTDMQDEMKRIHNDPNLDFTNPDIRDELEGLIDQQVTEIAQKDVVGTQQNPITPAMQAEIQSEQNSIVLNGTTVQSTDANGNIITTTVKSKSQVLADLQSDINAYAAGSATSITGQLGMLGLTELTSSTDAQGNVTVSSADSSVDFSQAKSSQIKYNGTTLKGDSNVITVNGLTITIKGETSGPVSLNVSNNTEETYDMIKNFVKSYNSILTEMNSIYYAASARDYAPLSDEERESMSDDQVKKWEDKIKDSILRRDDTVGSILSTMKMSTNKSIEVNGKRYSLASFGIQTSTDFTEKGLLHISGDKDDPLFKSQDDKLMKAIKEDPELVTQVFSGIASSMWADLGEKCKGISNVRSARKFYNDKEMEKTQEKYKSQIKILEKKLTKMEDKYYKQFAAMESALARMQSQSNSLAGMLG